MEMVCGMWTTNDVTFANFECDKIRYAPHIFMDTNMEDEI